MPTKRPRVTLISVDDPADVVAATEGDVAENPRPVAHSGTGESDGPEEVIAAYFPT